MFRGTVFALLLFLAPAGSARAQNEALKVQQSFNAAAEKTKQAVVSLKVVKEESETLIEPEFYFGYIIPRERTYKYDLQGMGAGFFIDAEGHILTNYHVVEGASRIRVSMIGADGRERTYIGTVTGQDPALDLAVVKIKSGGSFPFLELDRGPVKVGDFVMAVGYPFGFRQTFTFGIVSAVNAGIKVEDRQYEKLIQTDAAINQGNSGGPLLHLDGKVIGMNTAIVSPSGAFAGIGFAIPISEVQRVLPDLIAGRKIKRGWIGVALGEVDPVIASRLGLKSESGAIVNAVAKGSPADLAGIQRGDVIVASDGEPVEKDEDLFYRTYTKRPGDQMSLELLRNGARKTVRVTLAERPAQESSIMYKSGKAGAGETGRKNAGFSWEGMELRYENDEAVVESVSPESKLFGYLQRGDVLKAVNGTAIGSAAEMRAALGKANVGEGVLFDIERDGEPMYISVQMK